MPTYKQIQEHVRMTRQYVPKTCWIADIKARHNLTTRQSPNRMYPDLRMHPCPPERWQDLEEAMRETGALAEET